MGSCYNCKKKDKSQTTLVFSDRKNITECTSMKQGGRGNLQQEIISSDTSQLQNKEGLADKQNLGTETIFAGNNQSKQIEYYSEDDPNVQKRNIIPLYDNSRSQQAENGSLSSRNQMIPFLFSVLRPGKAAFRFHLEIEMNGDTSTSIAGQWSKISARISEILQKNNISMYKKRDCTEINTYLFLGNLKIKQIISNQEQLQLNDLKIIWAVQKDFLNPN